MRIKLSYRFNIYIGGILLLGIFLHMYHDLKSEEEFLNQMGIKEAEQLTGVVFDQLYTSMRLKGGREENRSIIDRFSRVEHVDEVRVIHGAALDSQYGVEQDEAPRDELDRSAMKGRPASAIERDKAGYRAARFVKPVIIKGECTRCHRAMVGEVNGAISARISLKKYEGIIGGHIRELLLWGFGTFFITSLAVLVMVQKRLLGPLEKLKAGVDALCGGDLRYRVGVKTGDEIETLGRSFNTMAESLLGATERLEEVNEKYTKLVQAAADPILLSEIESGRYVDANRAAEELTGYTRAELLGLGPEGIYPAQRLAEYRDASGKWLREGKGYLHGSAITKKDGSTAPIEIAASVLDFGGRRHIQEIWRDLSERKKFVETIKKHVAELEQTVKERTAGLNKSVCELETAYSRLQSSEQRLIQSAKLISLGEMGAGIAHELNSPLAGILSITEVLINRSASNDPNLYLLEKIRDAAVRSKFIIRDMLTYSRPSREGFTPIYLNEAIRATICLFTSELKTSSLEIVEDFDHDLPRVLGNKGQMMEVALNIIKNARDAVNGRGKLFISTRTFKEGGSLFAAAEFRDTGPGIPDEIRDKVFDPFFTTKEKGGGVNIGLGLSICQTIIKEHGGRIEVDSSPGQGATFRLILPIQPVQKA